MAIFASTLARIKSDPLACLGGKQRVNDHFAQAGHLWRDRVLDPAATLMLFILQVLHGNTAISHLKHLSGITTAESSYCNARRPICSRHFHPRWLCGSCVIASPSVADARVR
jgi:hypothetical protein